MLIDVLRRERLPPQASGLDLCTGSGILAIAAARSGCATVSAVDISRRAVLAARLNGALNGFQIDALRGDLYGPLRARRFDLIVSNPPYVPTPNGQLPRRGLRRAWEGGPNGRVFLDRICHGAGGHLRPGGVLLLVHSAVASEQASVETLTAQGLHPEVVLRHSGGLGPVLRGRRQWLREQRLLNDYDLEEMLVIRAQAGA